MTLRFDANVIASEPGPGVITYPVDVETEEEDDDDERVKAPRSKFWRLSHSVANLSEALRASASSSFVELELGVDRSSVTRILGVSFQS